MKRILVALALCSATQVVAQGYPTKPIRVVSPFGAGNPADTIMRLLAQKMAASMNQPVLVDPNLVASGVGAGQVVARSSPDGHTLLYALSSQIMIPPLLLKEKPFDPLRDFTPITSVHDAYISIAAAPSFPARTVSELIAYAKANPGKINYGTNGIGGTYHLEMELFKQQFGLDMVQVPYKGTVDSVQGLLSGEIPMVYAPVGSIMSNVKAGKMRILVLLGYKRAAELPDIPAMGEEIPNYSHMPTAVNLYGPAGLPGPINQRVYSEVTKALEAPDALAKIKDLTFYPLILPPAELAAKHKQDFEVIARAVKAAKLEPK